MLCKLIEMLKKKTQISFKNICMISLYPELYAYITHVQLWAMDNLGL